MKRPQTSDRSTLALLALGFIFWVLACGGGTPPTSTIADLNASIRFTGTQFVIENKGLEPWRNVELDLNGGAFTSGYLYRFDSLAAGETATVGAMQFANSDGQRFNPLTHKPQRLTVEAILPNGQTGMYFGAWK